MKDDIFLVASGDSRLSANRVCWPAQQRLEAALVQVFRNLGRNLVRAHEVDPARRHGFLDGQAAGIEAFRRIDPEVPLDRRRSGLAVHEPRPARAYASPRPDPDASRTGAGSGPASSGC